MQRSAGLMMALAGALCVVLGPSAPPTAVAATIGSLHLDSAHRPNGAIGIVGDSLTYAYFNGFDDSLRAQQWGPIGVEVRSARRTTVTADIATSGLDAVRRLRTQGFDSSIWVVALGTNDISFTYGDTSDADALIDTMMGEIGAGRRVVWVNVFAKSSSGKAKAIEFNDRLAVATSRHPLLTIADWFTLASANVGWFVDDVHTNLTGAIARNEFVAQAALVPRCPLPSPSAPPWVPSPVLSPAVEVGTATAVAIRRCRV